ncbi:hypothetical protein BVX98_05980 [bacterium F11]|nr:hypothetical protein BVX98_05980 [bacterium F11]
MGHDALANTSLVTTYENHPFRSPADSASFEIHKRHDFLKFGCVVCHGGQGLATEMEPAHGFVKHWESPLRRDVILQASCVQCHDNKQDLIIKGKNYTSEIIRAEHLFREKGCIGCHQIGGEGGPISVDLKMETAVKSLTRIDFSYTGLSQKEKTLENWIKLHFLNDPIELVPGDPTGEFNAEPVSPSGMPPYLLNKKDSDALTAYIMGLDQSRIPHEFRVYAPPQPKTIPSGKIKRGRWVYEEYGCIGCHGYQGRGGVRNYNYVSEVIPNLRRAVSTYSRKGLKDKISNGVPVVAKHDPQGPYPPLYMPAWKDKIKPDQLDDLVTYLFSIRE